jgi:phosphatidylinositol alpha-1,6-mannosyltransferase
MKRTLLLARVFPPRVGGIEAFMAELYQRAARRGLPVRVLAPWEPGAEAFDAASPLNVVRFSKPPLVRDRFYGPLAPMLARAMLQVRKFRPVEIHCDQLDSAIVGLLLRRIWGIPYMTFAYGMEVTDGRFRWLRDKVFGNADKVVAISEHMRRLLIGEVGVSPDRVQVIHPGVDVDRFAPRSRPGELARRLGLTDRRVILTVARLASGERYKGHDTVIRAMPTILSQVPDAAYLVVGDGPDRERLEGLVGRSGVAARVVFAGSVPDKDLPDYYNLCDVFTMVSRRGPTRHGGYRGEGFGIVYLEAAACGKPVVAGNDGGVAEAVEDGRTGLLIDPTSVEATADSLVRLLQDEELARRLGGNGRRRACAGFTWDRAADELMTTTNGCSRPSADAVASTPVAVS